MPSKFPFTILCLLSLFALQLSPVQASTFLHHLSLDSQPNLLITTSPQTNGSVPILQDSHGLYIEASLTTLEIQDSQPSSKLVKMMLSLPFNDTVLTQPDFDPSDPSTTTHPYFPFKVQKTKIDLSLDPTYWSLQTSGYYGPVYSPSKDRAGIIGLGMSGESSKNYQTSKIFTVLLDKNVTRDGKLFFKEELSNSSSSNIIANFSANSNWQTTVSGGRFEKALSYKFPASVRFDLNTEDIILPSSMYDQILLELLKYYKVSPSELNFKYTGKIDSLPTLRLEVSGEKVTISPRVYAKNVGKNLIALAFKSFVFDSSNEVSWGDAENVIVLGRCFMRNYVVVFDGSGQTNNVRLYKIGLNNGFPWILIVLAVLGLFVVWFVVGAGRYLYRLKKNQRSGDEGGYQSAEERPEVRKLENCCCDCAFAMIFSMCSCCYSSLCRKKRNTSLE